jgi:hypothetical protein
VPGHGVSFAFPFPDGGLADALVFWFFVAAWLVVLGLLVFGVLPRAVRDGRRIVSRLMRLVDESPLPLQLSRADADLQRINAALERIPPLQRRAQLAIATIRTTPLVPPSIGRVIRQIKAEIRAFREALR